MFSKYRARFHPYELESKYFQPKVSKIGEKILDSVPEWLGYCLFVLYWILHMVLAIFLAFLIDRNAPYALGVLIFWLLISIYYISKMRFQSASYKLLLDFYEDYSFEITAYEIFLNDKEVHFLKSRQVGHEFKRNIDEYLQEKLGKDFPRFNIDAFKKIYDNQNSKELDDFYKVITNKQVKIEFEKSQKLLEIVESLHLSNFALNLLDKAPRTQQAMLKNPELMKSMTEAGLIRMMDEMDNALGT